MDFATQILPILELGLNTALMLTGVPGGAALASSLEQSLNPLIASIEKKSTTTTDVLAGYAAAIGVLNALKQTTGLNPAVLAKVTEYIAAAQDATTAFLVASHGLDLSKLTPVAPIA